MATMHLELLTQINGPIAIDEAYAKDCGSLNPYTSETSTMPLDETATEQFLTVDQVASRYNTSTCSIYRWKSEGDFPKAVHLGNPPTRHPVREHERHYRSGKVVLIKEHHRGQAPDPGLPTRVMGPRLNAADFAFPADK